jgi:peptidoglycan hydrolase-like protein with peptidoglycan-binding domain
MSDQTPTPKKAAVKKTAKPKPVESPVEEVVEAPIDAPKPAAKVEPAPRRSALNLELKRTLSQGDAGAQVKQCQELLAVKGFFTSPQDGHYGTRMARAVRQFQSVNGLRINGEINPTTWEVLAK